MQNRLEIKKRAERNFKKSKSSCVDFEKRKISIIVILKLDFFDNKILSGMQNINVWYQYNSS